ncbi:MAG: DUF6263 family protein [Ferruginibacter sp.]|nr:DUF6263 family protein [Ferruginibacter sp.]
MKKILLLSLCFATVYVNAQNIKLNNGRKITATTTTAMDMDMGMAGQMKMASTSVNIINVSVTEDKQYKATNTPTKLTMSQEGMGQSISFDSDKKEDRESEMGKTISKQLDAAAEITIEKSTGKVTEINKKTSLKDEGDKNPLADIMGDTKSAEATAASAFFVIPTGKKAGDKWTDSTTEAGMKGIKNYELKSINDGIATIAVKSSAKGTISKEVQGMQLDINMTSTGDGAMIVDTKTGLVKKNDVTSDVNGTLDVMGQSMPITMKMVASSVFE